MTAKIEFDLSCADLEVLSEDAGLLDFLNSTLQYEYDDKVSLRDFYWFIFATANQLELFNTVDEEILDRLRFCVGQELVAANNLDVNLSKFLAYIEMPSDHITIMWLETIGGGGEFDEEDGIQFEFRSNESNHYAYPHVHVRYKGNSASLSIETGKMLAGKLPKKQEKEARRYILNNQQKFYKGWNDHTNGKKVCIA